MLCGCFGGELRDVPGEHRPRGHRGLMVAWATNKPLPISLVVITLELLCSQALNPSSQKKGDKFYLFFLHP